MLTIGAAAVVILLPTACDYAVATTGGSSGGDYGAGSGYIGRGGAPTVSDVETVPAGNTETLPPAEYHAAGLGDPGAVDPDPTEETSTGETTTEETTTEETTTDETSTEETTTDETTTDETTTDETTTETTTTTPPVVTPPGAAPLEILGSDCSTSDLAPHTGFQDSPRCVATAFGEVAAAALSPSLLITNAPTAVASGEAFTLTVSTRNLKRDRFLGAAAGGYYRESSFLNEQGVQRGHFHTACRLLPSTDVAPDAEPKPEFFLATQDNGGGGSAPDQVDIPISPITGTGTLQCAVWAGDGSHRVPMMTRANQTPAFDIVRIQVG